MEYPQTAVHAAFQPLVNIRLGGIVAVEVVARWNEHAQRDGAVSLPSDSLTRDLRLTVAAVRASAECRVRLPLHLTVLASTVVRDSRALMDVRRALWATGRHEHEVILEIRPPLSQLDPDQLHARIEELRNCGFRIAVGGVGEGHVPPTLVTDLRPDFLKLAPAVLRGFPETRGRLAIVESFQHMAEAIGSNLVVDGIDDQQQLAAVRRLGIRLVQGNLLAPSSDQPPSSTQVSIPAREISGRLDREETSAAAGPLVTEFMSPATSLPDDALADEARQTFAEHPEISGIVLVDEEQRPRRTIDRNRFLLAVTGPYGHALHAKKPASRLADKPRIVTTSTTATETLRLVTSSDRNRVYDDAVVVDEAGRCLGVVRASDLVRGVTDQKVEEAAALNPLTRLPGSGSIAREICRRLDQGDEFTVGWLDVDSFKTLNDHAGIAACDDLIRAIGRSLTDVATSMGSVQIAHVGGDDFLIACAPADLEALASAVLDPPRTVGGTPVSLSLATLAIDPCGAAGYDEIAQRLAPLKRFAKALHGSSWVMSRPGTEHIEVLRGREESRAEHGLCLADDQPEQDAAPSSEPDVALTRLRRSSQRFTDLLAVAPVGIGLFDQSERLVDANDALCRLLGYRLDQLRGCTADDLSHPQDQAGSLRPAKGKLSPDGANPSVLQRLLLRADGQPVSCELHTSLSVQDDGSQFWLVVFQDITERHRQAEILHHRATHDDLTGLPNRAAVKELLGAYLNGPERTRTAVLFCDIDKFKRINDSLGHDAGDELLVALARILENGVPPECTVVRLSGDEFVIVCSDINAVGGLDALATRVSALLRTAIPVQGQLIRVSASIGAAMPSQGNNTADDLLRFADVAMFEAKRSGLGKVSLASPTLIASADGQLHMEGELRAALARDELELHYQPVVASDGSIVGAEALVRWPHPERGLLTPGDFLPIAEQGDLLGKLDRWVLRAALHDAVQWPMANGQEIRIAVNLAGLVPGDPKFIPTISDTLNETGIDPARVVLELVETALVDLPTQARSAMHALAERGVSFAVDDFGTGYSSLARLKELPAQIIKADRRFISGIGGDPADFAVTRAVVDMARAMGRRCIAEGVETAIQFHVLKGLGVDAYQGWLFSHAIPHHDLRDLLRKGTLLTPDAQ
ncbi:EAL domain-containing protein [Saccharopolyspora sp. K220]|uniref:EAL domain-containing protein n=1 Tax=Saccharopolyspora soli TaxID=2926618 RepID=UPI001F56EFD1|nr:EAL domain-containing protein [Saccharopolyspora soli]MCI2417271.1 EAL domain-containing protein [Saccharopolyspora soli]